MTKTGRQFFQEKIGVTVTPTVDTNPSDATIRKGDKSYCCGHRSLQNPLNCFIS